MNTVGKNTIAGDQLLAYVERIEQIEAEMRALRDDKSAIVAEAKANGFSPPGIRYLVKVRAMKPHDRQEADAIRDTYMHAIGLDGEPPLFRLMGLMEADITAREGLIEHFKKFAPAAGQGDIILRLGGEPVRLWRDKEGEAHVDPYVDPVTKPREPAAPKPPRSDRPKPAVPDVDDDGAEKLGAQYARENKPVIENPFPYGDTRRARFDEGWRRETGGDGMGPREDE